MTTYGYSQQTWTDNSSSTPLTAARLAHIEQGLSAAYPFINVKDSQFGAVGDGVTDDSAAIQAAINTLDANRAGTIYFPQGIYLLGSAVTCNVPGATFIGDGQSGVSSDLAKGSTQIRVANGIWGLTLGSTTTTEYRGFRLQNLHFYEQNAGGALGLVRVYRSSGNRFVNTNFGACTAGWGLLVDGTGGESSYNVIDGCKFGTCNRGYEQKAGNGTRMVNCYFEGHHNTNGVTADGRIGCLVTSGDTFTAIGTVFQGYDTLVDLSANVGHKVAGCRFEIFATQAIIVRGGAGAHGATIHGSIANSIQGNVGTGITIESGVVAPEIDLNIEAVATPYTDAGSTNPTMKIRSSTAAWNINVAPSVQFGSASGPTITQGAGSPAGVVSAPVGSLFLRSDGGASTTLYVKESGVGATGWVAK